jgi:hypothetical protein
MRHQKDTPLVKNEIQTKDVLDKLLEEMNKSGDIEITNQSERPALVNTAGEFHLNYETVTTESETKAKEIVDSIVNFYLDDTLKDDPYIAQKMSLDIITISNLLFQMVTSEHAIKILLREIDNGNFQARMFEVLGGLQKSKMEIVKHLKQVEIIMENNYKSLMIEYENRGSHSESNNTNNHNNSEINSNGGTVGTKALLQQMRNKIKTIESEHPDELDNQQKFDEFEEDDFNEDDE